MSNPLEKFIPSTNSRMPIRIGMYNFGNRIHVIFSDRRNQIQSYMVVDPDAKEDYFSNVTVPISNSVEFLFFGMVFRSFTDCLETLRSNIDICANTIINGEPVRDNDGFLMLVERPYKLGTIETDGKITLKCSKRISNFVDELNDAYRDSSVIRQPEKPPNQDPFAVRQVYYVRKYATRDAIEVYLKPIYEDVLKKMDKHAGDEITDSRCMYKLLGNASESVMLSDMTKCYGDEEGWEF